MKRLIKKILKEDRRQMFLDNIVKYMKNDFPLFNNMKLYGFYEQLSEDELNYVFSEIFGKPVQRKIQSIYDDRRNELYYEEPNGRWEKYEYDENNNLIYSENSHGTWVKREFDKNGNLIYFENSNGDWRKREYDENGRKIYEESDNGYWWKREYDENGKILYYENSDGVIRDYR